MKKAPCAGGGSVGKETTLNNVHANGRALDFMNPTP